MMRPWFARLRIGHSRRRVAKLNCYGLRAEPRGGFRRRSIRRWATLLSGGCRCFRPLVLYHFQDVARPWIAHRIVARRITGGVIRPIRVGTLAEQHANDWDLVLLDGNDQRRLTHSVGCVDP